ncbi:DUF4198 domain-containing protein [Stutzerimonas kirkiae]|uniref:DUF4198 domain-containing protein n=1 Tax=Stutzerimonas kirkiae TaxID=2211392 RepID=A0A4V2KDE8_9GAMM|nr:DUF4198 domain-containing protein [Stutzerimonas kirkiae]TBU98945.1 DUF4198 domain-containing protein [Stutzerimonas kirkiae]TBV01595.1 DUF4198 domain-containing protein [Stutzerimonas kirkiae]TBV10301.1 DUF4198 domain-containing protein [Stutzerimonas kirkiae]TBV16909.1 DUF4198 domain-containing protein [Stutzerimonas kirkiae]
MKSVFKWTALALVTCLPFSAQAHRAWLLPSATVLSGEAPWITVDAAVSNDLFYFEHFPLRLQGIGDLGQEQPGARPRPAAQLQLFAPDGSPAKAENGSIGRYRSTFDVELKQKGTYKIAVANSGLFASWKENGQNQRWMGSAEAFAKAVPAKADDLKVSQNDTRMEVFVTSGNPTETVLKTTGKGLELAPITHPNDLFAGETAEFAFLLDGKPAADVEISVVPGGNRYRDDLGEINLKTDAQGKVAITWPTAGMYWLEAELKTTEGVSKPASERRASYSVTLEVLPQ